MDEKADAGRQIATLIIQKLDQLSASNQALARSNQALVAQNAALLDNMKRQQVLIEQQQHAIGTLVGRMEEACESMEVAVAAVLSDEDHAAMRSQVTASGFARNLGGAVVQGIFGHIRPPWPTGMAPPPPRPMPAPAAHPGHRQTPWGPRPY